MAIEFSRNVTFGQYIDTRSAIHRLDPRTKLLCTAGLMLALLASSSFVSAGVAVAALAAAIGLARIPVGYMLRGLRLLVGTMLVLFCFQVLFYPAEGAQVLWRWGWLAITWEGLRLGMITLLRVVLLYTLVTTLMLTTTLMDLADGLEVMLAPLARLRIPVNELVMTLVIALKFVPLLVGEVERLVKAKAARGQGIDTGGLLGRARAVGGILVPLFVGAMARAEVVATAMDARCYRGGRGRTKRRVLHLARADWLALAAGALATAAALAAGI